jgi:ribosome recycling factor
VPKTDLEDVKRRMGGAVEVLRRELTGLRTGRASVSLLEPLTVDAYGSKMPMNQVASVSAPEARMLTVQVWDRGLVQAVDRAIRESNLGLNPKVEGQVLRVPIPELSEERRKELVKVAHKYSEQARVSVRNVRRDGMEKLKRREKDGDISKDEHRHFADEIQKATDQHIKSIDDVLAHKEREIMHV